MTDNSINDKYIIPYLRNLNIDIDSVPPRIRWDINGNPDINTNVITFYEKTGDYVQSIELFDIVTSGLVIQCKLPQVSFTDNFLYIGTYEYGISLSNNKLTTYYGANFDFTVPYNRDDLYLQYFDGTYVNFVLNGVIIGKKLIDKSILRDKLYFGFDHSNDTYNEYSITYIYSYVTGVNGQVGADGLNCTSILTDYKNHSDVPTELVSYGNIGDYFLDKRTNKLYGPKLGLCGSIYFDGDSNTYLSIPNHIDFRFGTGDFTIEWFQYTTTVVSSHYRIFSMGHYPSASIAVSIEGGSFYLWLPTGGTNIGTVDTLNEWIHIAIVRSGNYIQVYKNGIKFGNRFVNNSNLTDSSNPLIIGNEINGAGNSCYAGHITNFNWIKGIAKYSSNFDVSRVPFTSTANTGLLLNAVNYASLITDSSTSATKTVTNHNNRVAWNVRTPFQSVGTWIEPSKVFDPPAYITSLDSGGSTVVWDFAGTSFNSVLIYLTFAADTLIKIPTNLVLIAANKGTDNIVRWNRFSPSNLPSDVQMYTVGNGTNLTIGVNSFGSNPAYPYVGVKIFIIA